VYAALAAGGVNNELAKRVVSTIENALVLLTVFISCLRLDLLSSLEFDQQRSVSLTDESVTTVEASTTFPADGVCLQTFQLLSST
jgi:hypothetical protein